MRAAMGYETGCERCAKGETARCGANGIGARPRAGPPARAAAPQG
ncbi:hypothetical protein BURPSPAST_D0451 [Burkholderia pseudomallei Pasteur 52237]|nr:hypothetical protein BURPSPAST_D0451 [Burkholderia pseudomallei Pasteur 52237]